MIRQGRQDPRLSQGGLLRVGLRKLGVASRASRCAFLFAVALLGLSVERFCFAQELKAGTQGMRVRISWGGGSEQAWQVTARLEGGQLRDPRLLGLTPETPGSAELAGNELRIVQQIGRAHV